MIASSLRGVPRGVVVLGLVSLLMDASSELVHALLPLFLVTTLGVSMITVGLLEGVAEATAMIVKVFSGYVSDWTRRRKPLVLAGYSLGALSKLAFPLANGVGLLAGARIVDRIGKGIRGAPRDALIADLAPPEARGASYGLRQALDSVGAIVGPLLAVAAMAVFAGDIRSALWVAVVPAALCVMLILFGVKEPERDRSGDPVKRITLADVTSLDRRFVFVTSIAVVLTLGRFSEAFLVLRASDVGMPLAHAPWVMVAMTLTYAAFAFPAGAWADRGHAKRLFGIGLVALIASDVVLAEAGGPVAVLAGAALWGLHLALTQGLLLALVAAIAPPALRGTAFGVFNLATGITLFVASAVAGLLWELVGPASTFYAGAAFTMIAGLVLVLRRNDLPSLR
ncbi:MAG TPA: MFS transporter [Casimicrobiaceae bacterium]|nr:MFS transporter [Casimicrobiaceae bacterium]